MHSFPWAQWCIPVLSWAHYITLKLCKIYRRSNQWQLTYLYCQNFLIDFQTAAVIKIVHIFFPSCMFWGCSIVCASPRGSDPILLVSASLPLVTCDPATRGPRGETSDRLPSQPTFWSTTHYVMGLVFYKTLSLFANFSNAIFPRSNRSWPFIVSAAYLWNSQCHLS